MSSLLEVECEYRGTHGTLAVSTDQLRYTTADGRKAVYPFTKLKQSHVLGDKGLSLSMLGANGVAKTVALSFNSTIDRDGVACEVSKRGSVSESSSAGKVKTVSLTRAEIDKILEEDETTRHAFESHVPGDMTEKQFWEKYMRSQYFHRKRNTNEFAVHHSVDLTRDVYRNDCEVVDEHIFKEVNNSSMLLQSQNVVSEEFSEPLSCVNAPAIRAPKRKLRVCARGHLPQITTEFSPSIGNGNTSVQTSSFANKRQRLAVTAQTMGIQVFVFSEADAIQVAPEILAKLLPLFTKSTALLKMVYDDSSDVKQVAAGLKKVHFQIQKRQKQLASIPNYSMLPVLFKHLDETISKSITRLSTTG